MKQVAIELLNERGVQVEDIAEIVYDIQENYVVLNMDDCIEAVKSVLLKREVQTTTIFAIQLDKLAERGMFEEPIHSLIVSDNGLFGLDEVLAFGLANLYGSIGISNFGYLDKIKPRIVGELDVHAKRGGCVTTFLDDIVCAIAAAAAAKLAHTMEPKPRRFARLQKGYTRKDTEDIEKQV